ncbi:hypothetical protein [Bellilinea caldifistulae]|uniref:Uncharacterized protein n=1 Tax=Bellilinea caldifistulae TaxID=360411 RepID=A0A0P6XMJ5_9CHLR|nr:hypothetical protein [Bellilinea caldifistulae]KPL77611.1 hypothetical protein AC812_03540 [Bellilinea caldifistulae]
MGLFGQQAAGLFQLVYGFTQPGLYLSILQRFGKTGKTAAISRQIATQINYGGAALLLQPESRKRTKTQHQAYLHGQQNQTDNQPFAR